MSEAHHFDVDSLTFVYARPRRFATPASFRELRGLRKAAYAHDTDLGRRSTAERDHFLGRLTVGSWLDPRKSPDANPGQGYKKVVVTAALGPDEELKGFSYTALNVSSTFERKLLQKGLPRTAAAIGGIERFIKWRMPGRFAYAWTRETVIAPDVNPRVAAVLGAAAMANYPRDRKAAIYYFDEQADFDRETGAVGYERGTSEPVTTEAFGPYPRVAPALEVRAEAASAGAVGDAYLQRAGLTQLPQIAEESAWAWASGEAA